MAGRLGILVPPLAHPGSPPLGPELEIAHAYALPPRPYAAPRVRSRAYNTAMPTTPSAVRLLAVVMVIVVLLAVTTPARAEADVLLIAGIASLAVVGAILLAYLIVAAGSDLGSDASLEEPARVRLVHVAQAS